MQDLNKITTMLTLNLGQLVIASFFYPVGVMRGCPMRRKTRKSRAAGRRQNV